MPSSIRLIMYNISEMNLDTSQQTLVKKQYKYKQKQLIRLAFKQIRARAIVAPGAVT